MTWERRGTTAFYALPRSTQIIQANRLSDGRIDWVLKVISRPTVIRKTIKRLRPDTIISFMDTMNIAALTASLGLNVPVVVSERNDPLHSISGARRVIRDQLYRLADRIVCQTKQAANYFPESYQSKIRVIPNPVFKCSSKARPAIAASNGRFRIISVGRLAAQKGQDLLIDSFARIAGNWSNWDLVIFGEGPRR